MPVLKTVNMLGCSGGIQAIYGSKDPLKGCIGILDEKFKLYSNGIPTMKMKFYKDDGCVNVIAAHKTMHVFVKGGNTLLSNSKKKVVWDASRDKAVDKLGMDKDDPTTFGWVQKDQLEVRTGSVLQMQPTAC